MVRRLAILLDGIGTYATPAAWGRLRSDTVALTNSRAVNRGVPRKPWTGK
jgi:hypothetical protein